VHYVYEGGGWSGRDYWLRHLGFGRHGPLGGETNGTKEVSGLQNVGLACPNCKTTLSYKGTTEKNDFVLFECKSEHCPLKVIVLVGDQISQIMKPILRV
jgi:hypothetical protein